MFKKIDLKQLTVSELMLLQVEVNNLVVTLQTKAEADLRAGKPNKYFILKPGNKTRFIKEPEKYTAVLKKVFDESYNELCMEHKQLAMTNIEKLVKKQFDSEDAQEILTDLNQYIDKKPAKSKLTYSPQGKE